MSEPTAAQPSVEKRTPAAAGVEDCPSSLLGHRDDNPPPGGRAGPDASSSSSALAPVAPSQSGASASYLAPHTHRLLRLLQQQDDSANKNHSTAAVERLIQLTPSLSHGQAWELQGRLQALLRSRRWTTRIQAATALGGVARNCPLELRGEGMLVEADTTDNNDNDDHRQKGGYGTEPFPDPAFTLTVNKIDLPKLLGASTNVDQHLLLARPMLKERQRRGGEGVEINDADNDDDCDLPLEVSARLDRQKRILLHRLGLSGLVSVIGEAQPFASDLDMIADDDDDDHLPATTVSASAPPKDPDHRRPHQSRAPRRGKKRRRPCSKGRHDNNDDDCSSDDEKDLGDDNTFRALLLAAKATASSPSESSSPYGSAAAAVDHPRSVLAADLLCRMVDPYWHVRHGAFLGALALLRNGWTTTSSTPAVERDDAWPEAVLAVSLCVLALDRFGDFSGAAVTTSDDATSEANDAGAPSRRIVAASVVAPVRELAGQVLAVTWIRAPIPVQERVLKHLFAMRGNAEIWDVRHAALVAFKYMAALLRRSPPPSPHHGPGAPSTDPRLDPMVQSAIEALRDECDDVKTVAAQLLLEHFQGACDREGNMHSGAIANVWKAVVAAESHAACLVDVVALLCWFAEDDCSRVLRLVQKDCAVASEGQESTAAAAFVQTLARLMDSEYTSVKMSVLQCIQSVALPLASRCGSLGDSAAYRNLVARVYDSLFNDGSDDFGVLGKTRNAAWKVLVQACPTAFAQNDESWYNLAESLVCRYFCLHRSRGGLIKSIESQSKAADALTLFVQTVEGSVAFMPIIALALLSFLHSPWPSQCEATCLLLSSWSLSGTSNKDPLASKILSETWFHSVTSLLRGWIAGESRPTCVALDPHRSQTLRNALDDASTIGLCDDAFLHATRMVRAGDRSLLECCDFVVALWRRTFGVLMDAQSDSLSDSAANVHSMRLYASIAGAVLSTGLPPKITPVVRSLMTSLTNETSPCRLARTSRALCALLLAIEDVPRFCTAREKVLNSLCSMSLAEESSRAQSASASAQIVTLYLTNITETKSIQDAQPVWSRIAPLLTSHTVVEHGSILRAARFLRLVASGLGAPLDDRLPQFCKTFLRNLVRYACQQEELRIACVAAIGALQAKYRRLALADILFSLHPYLADTEHRGGACVLLESTVVDAGEAICPFVRALLPVAMSLMTDPNVECARLANKIFGTLVRMAPLVDQGQDTVRIDGMASPEAESMMDHLIGGKPLPCYSLPPNIKTALSEAKLTLRTYQQEGIAWLHFLWSMNLNGALCDSMGLGKTVQALIAIAVSHFESNRQNRSLIVCPSTLVGHWRAEIDKCFVNCDFFQPLCYVGNRSERDSLWPIVCSMANLVITSYSILRTDVELLSKHSWHVCVLDEGHLLRNAKTATARASRRLRANHRLILTGTPVQNKVNELWAAFDFLMPNFLGTASSFAKEFEGPIVRGHAVGAQASRVADGIEKLRILHQQVLPFILRREKHEVLRELPPKVISYVKVPLSEVQQRLYNQVTSRHAVSASLKKLKQTLCHKQQLNDEAIVDSVTLKSLLILRLICTHPALVCNRGVASCNGLTERCNVDMSGKLSTLLDMLRTFIADDSDLMAADNDPSLLYCDDDDEEISVSGFQSVVRSVDDVAVCTNSLSVNSSSSRKCIIFSQFTKSLDVVENFVLKPFMPRLRYIRLDSQVAPNKRSGLASRFNNDPSIRLFLATTRVGGLGLNLTAADTVMFLENDYNPFVDIQAQDRAHRIGQQKSVSVYYFVTQDTIEETIIEMQNKKLAVSEAIVNSENSSMYSMGTDRLLDIFNHRSSVDDSVACDDALLADDELIDQSLDEYASLSVEDFLRGLDPLVNTTVDSAVK